MTNQTESKQTSQSSDILDIEGAANLLGFKVSSLYQLTSKRIIPHFKVQGIRKVYFSKKELEEWVLNPSNKVTTSQELAILAITRCQN